MNPDFLNQSPREQMMERMGLQPHLMGLESHYGGGGNNNSGGGGKNKKTLTPAQKRFKEREAKGLDGFTGLSKVTKSEREKGVTSLTKYRDHQKKTIQEAARVRNEAFKAKRDLKKDPLNTDAQVAKDNAMYGNTFPSGGLTISAEGVAQAEANKKAAREEATRKSTFNPNRLSFDSNAALNYAKGLNAFSVANMVAPGQNLGSWYNTGSDPTKSFRQVMGDEWSMRQRTQGAGKGGWNPIRGMPGYGTVKNILTGKKWNTPHEGGFATGPTEANRRVFNNLTKAHIAASLFKEGKTGSITDQIANETIGRFNPYAGTAGTDKFSTEAAKARERGSLLSIGGFKVPEFGLSEYMGINTADRAPKNVQVASTDSGGLNIGSVTNTADKSQSTNNRLERSIWSKAKGIADFAFNDRTDLDNLGKGFFGKGIVTPQDVKSDFKTSVKKIGLPETLALGIENVRDYNRIKDADNKALAFAQNVNADQFAKTLSFADDSKVVQKVGENLGTLFNQKNVNLPSDFKAQIRDTIEGAQNVTGSIEQGKVHNRFLMKNRVDEINNVLANINQNPKLSTLSKVAGQFDPATNPNAANMTNLQKIAAGFNPESPNVKALSATDRGIVGSGGNLLIGGKLSDIYRQATGNIKGGVNAGIPKGQTGLSNTDMFNVATSAIKNINTPGTLSAKQADSIKTTIKGGVTPSSLIRGVLPKFTRSGGGGSRPIGSIGGSASLPSIAAQALQDQQQPVEELLLPTNADRPNLQDIQQQAYNQQMSIYGAPNYMAQFQPVQRVRPLRRRQYFNRDYFTQFA